MSNDVNRFDESVTFSHFIWIAPTEALISVLILYDVIGASCLVGLGIAVFYIPLQSNYKILKHNDFLCFITFQILESFLKVISEGSLLI